MIAEAEDEKPSSQVTESLPEDLVSSEEDRKEYQILQPVALVSAECTDDVEDNDVITVSSELPDVLLAADNEGQDISEESNEGKGNYIC